MRLTSVELIDRKMEKEIEKFLDFTGRDYWKDVIIKADTTDGNFYKELYLLRRNPFIQPLKLYFQLRSEGRCIWKHKTNEMNDLARHAYVINRVVNNLGDNAKKYIRGKLRDEKGIKPFLFELHIATHFLRRGLEVVFSEYEARDISGKTFEFLVSGDGIEREIECKWKGVDAGRKITRPGFYILCDEIFKRVVPKIGGKRCIVELICNKSLGKNKNKLIEISENILQGINGGKVELVLGGDFNVKIHYLANDLEIRSEEQAVSAITPYYSEKFDFLIVSNSNATIIMKTESEGKDRVLKSIYDALNAAPEKFSKTRPALIACYIEEISSSEWNELIGENGLSAMTNCLLFKEEFKHIHTIAYSSESEPHVIGGVRDFKSDALFFKNSNCLYYKGEDIFFLKKAKENREQINAWFSV